MARTSSELRRPQTSFDVSGAPAAVSARVAGAAAGAFVPADTAASVGAPPQPRTHKDTTVAMPAIMALHLLIVVSSGWRRMPSVATGDQARAAVAPRGTPALGYIAIPARLYRAAMNS
jgi:hypothetical protein